MLELIGDTSELIGDASEKIGDTLELIGETLEQVGDVGTLDMRLLTEVQLKPASMV